MRKKLRISVVVIAYNSEETIRNCLNSLSKQNFPNKDYEIILVNDHSTDKTCEIAREYSQVRIINQIVGIRGIPQARNLGIKNAKYEIIAFTDSDCIVPRNWLNKISNFLNNNPKFIAVGGSLKAIKTDSILSKADGILGETYGNTSGLSTPNTGYLKHVLLKEGLFNEDLITGEDPDLNWRLLKKGYKLKYLKNIEVKHLWRSSLKSFIRHHFNYGRGREQLSKIHPEKFSFFERNIVLFIFIILLSFMFISRLSFIFSIIAFLFLLLSFVFLRRISLIKKISKKSNLLIFITILFLFIITDFTNMIGIIYQKGGNLIFLNEIK